MNDLDLLNMMIKDHLKQDSLYQLTNYWKYYEKSFIRHLKKHGIDFKHRAFHSMGAVKSVDRTKMYDDILCYLEKYVDMNSVKTIVELGFGGGQQTEIIKERYPDISFCLFDIPPMLYVGEQLLKEKYPDDVVGYSETKEKLRPPFDFESGKIYIFGNWLFPLIQYISVDLFINAGSFQEMEKDVVSNYLWYVNFSAGNVFLYECMDSVHGVKKANYKNNIISNSFGVLDNVCLREYVSGLVGFDLVDLCVYGYPYSLSFWKKK